MAVFPENSNLRGSPSTEMSPSSESTRKCARASNVVCGAPGAAGRGFVGPGMIVLSYSILQLCSLCFAGRQKEYTLFNVRSRRLGVSICVSELSEAQSRMSRSVTGEMIHLA